MRIDPLAYLGKELESLRDQKLFRQLRILEDEQKAHTTVDHKSVVNLSSNNYLGLTTHPKLRRAALQAIEQFGVGIEQTAEAHGDGDEYHRAQERKQRLGIERLQRYLDLWHNKYPVKSYFPVNRQVKLPCALVHDAMDEMDDKTWFAQARIGVHSDLEETLNDEIEKWHGGEGKDKELHQYLGMTFDEYASWVEQKKTLQQLIDESKNYG